jgi:hypothetical protein
MMMNKKTLQKLTTLDCHVCMNNNFWPFHVSFIRRGEIKKFVSGYF